MVGRVIYGATRSTAQIEKGGGRPGFAIVTVHERAPSWRFKEIGAGWPFVQILAPADYHMVTRSADPSQVPRPGLVNIVAKVLGDHDGGVTITIDGGPARTMEPTACCSFFCDVAPLAARLHEVSVMVGEDRDTIKIKVRAEDDTPRRNVPLSPGSDIHAIGAWPEHGIDGTQLGPKKNGMRW